MKDGNCPKCDNEIILQGVRVVDESPTGPGELSVAVYRWPERGEGEVRGKLRACVCAVCGFTELYATNLNELTRAAATAQAPE